jgi:hypothetical protein
VIQGWVRSLLRKFELPLSYDDNLDCYGILLSIAAIVAAEWLLTLPLCQDAGVI